ncbi:MAG TPA: type II toxin-antitoxin system RelE/ParE family toxin [Tepidisphaeraceae bacterium]|jgi:toxin ParE1/3/4|nr:type II toxin-antitoxin system RelE/ParE family toxin [Tepidisphaeraceae bacterium]
MAQVTLSRQSRLDLRDILLYIRQHNKPAARRFLSQITHQFGLLAEFPKLGPARGECGRNLRSLPIGNYVVFYRPARDGIQVVRVLHGARDFRRIFRRR